MFLAANHRRNTIVTLVLAFFLHSACTTEERFLDLGDGFAGPIDVASNGTLSFVLNSDFDRSYNAGSIVTIDANLASGSEKVAVHTVPRMGRSLSQQGQFLIGAFDRETLDSMGSVEIYSVSGTGTLTTVFQQDLDCSPISAKISPSQTWAVVSCISGGIYVSPFSASDASVVEFRLVRNYKYTHRALFFYESSGDDYLLGFPTDIGEQTAADSSATDQKSYVGTTTGAEGPEIQFDDTPNEVPDLMESSVAALFQVSIRYPYNMFILNLTKNQENDFLFKELGSVNKRDDLKDVDVGGTTKQVYEYANHELKFIYFTLPTNSAGEPTLGNVNSGETEESVASLRLYRTNFWDVQEATSNSFYLSHRGLAMNGSTDANNILQLTIRDSGDGSMFAGPAAASPSPFTATFADMFTVERIYGWSDTAKSGYVGDFEVVDLGSVAFSFVNQFRDEAYWSSRYRLYAIDSKKLGSENEAQAPHRWVGADYSQSAYQIATSHSNVSNQPAYLVSCSFYGNSVLIFDIDETEGILSTAEPRVIF